MNQLYFNFKQWDLQWFRSITYTYNDKTKTLNEPYSSIQWTLNDKNYTWISPEHCMVLIGYDLDTNVAIVSDPLRGIVEYDLDTVKARYLALNSQCVTFERKPIITGIENGVTYYTTQCVSILNHNFKSITLNGNDVEDVFLIHGNKEDTYRVTIIEANDNVIEYLIYTKPISSLFDALEGANEFSVTNNHLDDINNIKDTLSSVTTDYCSPEESKTIENSLMICDVMIENITQANSKYDEIFNIVESFKETPPTDATELTKQLENIMALASNQNLTVEQKTHLTQMQDLCNQYLKEINPIR